MGFYGTFDVFFYESFVGLFMDMPRAFMGFHGGPDGRSWGSMGFHGTSTKVSWDPLSILQTATYGLCL